MAKHQRIGFTLIELLIFSAIFSLIIGSFITVLIVMVNVQVSQSASGEASQQGQFLVQQLQYYIESARLVDMPQDVSGSSLTLREVVGSSSSDPTIFTVSSGTIYFQQGAAGTPQAFTSNKVTISNLSFTRHYNTNSSSSPYGTDSVSYAFTISSNAGNQQYSQSFQSSATVLAPVERVALIQQAKVEDNTGSSETNLSKAFPTNNESGDLLLAVVAYRGTATTSITDTNGNTWARIASTTTVTPIGTVALYNAANIASGANTSTVSFGSGATYASVMLYEYRGAATTAPFDAYGTQAQVGMSTPASPSVSPTSTVELLFGIDDNSNPTSATFSPGTGYTLESSSTGGNTTQVFVEGMNQYISNPVAAAWQSSVLTSSTAMIATFKVGAGSGGSSFTCGSPLVDARDSQSYTTVQIGTQCWMQQNLNVGTEIAGATNQGTNVSSAASIQKYCYSDNASNCTSQGGLYQWTQTVGGSSGCDGTGAGRPACTTPIQGVCPANWHIPSHYEWTQLERTTCTSGTCATDFPYDETTQG
jgi:uncharacterized protein (TIGR02145 family)